MSDTSDLRVDRLAILGSAIAGRRLVIRREPGQPTHTDGTSIVVDPHAEFADIRDGVVAQAALLAGGALRKDLMIRLARHRSAVIERYLSLELDRTVTQLQHVLPGTTIRRLASRTSKTAQRISHDADESLELAQGREPVAAPPDWCGTLLPDRLRRVDEEDLRAAPTDADLRRLGEVADDPEDDDGGEDSKILKLLSAPGLNNPLGDALQKLMGMGRRSPDKNQGGAELPAGTQRLGTVGRHARRAPQGRLGQFVSAFSAPPPAHGVSYPEWDCYAGEYRPDWCTAAEYDPADHDDVADSVPTGTSLRRPLARVGLQAQRHRRQQDGDGLDPSAIVDYAVHRSLGDHPDPNIFEHSRLSQRELSVLVLLDCSGSTAEHTAGHVVFEEERALAGEFTAALCRLGDRVGTFGFYSRGRHAVTFLRIKDFNAGFDAAAKHRLAAVQPSGFTRIGAAIRHATHLLESRALAKNMILVVIGDGLPYDDGYEDRYARADARQAIEEAIDRGIGVVGLGIRSSTEPEVLQEVWSVAPFRVVDDLTDVTRHVRGLLGAALAVTRSNGRRREVQTVGHRELRRAVSAAASRRNSYV
ncbi:VWA domain-containing protein [Mycolicibacterium pulveris]|nr:VWA domain-containing protein [Mycolicibacterium pulveris]MCV6981622.1 VWA domain-containing protein [Mycolicibacterium pulveris]